ncbi:hypothetical protein FACS189459_2340 [Bacilli bacterium]|nr:hypothetical protein FACS189459_2340 [Bacilli bacterium]
MGQAYMQKLSKKVRVAKMNKFNNKLIEQIFNNANNKTEKYVLKNKDKFKTLQSVKNHLEKVFINDLKKYQRASKEFSHSFKYTKDDFIKIFDEYMYSLYIDQKKK